ncbi:MAG: Re/Si-specific NAD(P)(+) transhydrogenase subunit alpha [Rhodospirillaceae bacterium]|nr:Re/Si-specific NAD(P)(+) transhydrogenase subunit alpha [Rhodospirillaceae bacterium]
MKVAIPRERRTGETRVAATPESIKKLLALGLSVHVESGAGIAAGVTDAAYEKAGATVEPDAAATYANADVVLKVQRPLAKGEGDVDEVSLLKSGAVLIGALAPYDAADALKLYAKQGVLAFSLELIPRITRAQSMDILSSQANLAGYMSVIQGAECYGSPLPMMMTAAGTVPPAKVFVMGAGVAGLQAIATARRLGGIVSATDVRPASKEEVQSLGANFIAVEDDEFKQAQTAGGYAKEMSAEYRAKQAALIAEHITKQDIVVCTALIPGRPAPTLVTEDMVKTMKQGSVIVDLAAERGGNCPLSKAGETIVAHGVTIIGPANMPAELPAGSSGLYSRNLVAFLTPMVNKEAGALAINWDDEIIAKTVLTRDGAIVHPQFAPAEKAKPAAEKSADSPAEGAPPAVDAPDQTGAPAS